jgi:hypothetical protein
VNSKFTRARPNNPSALPVLKNIARKGWDVKRFDFILTRLPAQDNGMRSPRSLFTECLE